jgi:hypothetical protein
MNNCGTCRHWRALAPDHSDDGECGGVGVSVYLQSKRVVLAGNIIPNPDGSSPKLVTDSDFGCVRWESR